MEKSNIEHLRDILKEFQTHDSIKADEAEEFLDAIESDIDDLKEEIRNAEDNEPDDDDKEEIAEDYIGDKFTKEYLGLDTIEYRLENGNLKIQMQLDQFLHNVKKQNLVTA